LSAKESSASWPTFKVDGELGRGIMLETIKRGEDDEVEGETSLILRFFESRGGKAKGVLRMYVCPAWDL
jgi:alpha-mannosidase